MGSEDVRWYYEKVTYHGLGGSVGGVKMRSLTVVSEEV